VSANGERKLALVFTVVPLIPVFQQLTRELLPDVETFNIVDESLLRDAIRDKGLTPKVFRRVARYVEGAEEAGADGILVTCSSIGPAVDAARWNVSVPLLRVDLPMAERAVEIGSRVGVLATLRATLGPTAALIERCGSERSRRVEVVAHVCEGAFDAVVAGDVATHDSLVRKGLQSLKGKVDVVVLAQASMARVTDALPDSELFCPILSSPRLGVERMAELLQAASP
jgi:Asp/Glu/hydantoin racemase